MKTIRVEILDKYKSYPKDTTYELKGDLIILSGINGCGKSQLMNIIAKNKTDSNRKVSIREDGGEFENTEDILLLSFRDNINLGDDFGHFSVTFQNDYYSSAWNFYSNNIKYTNNSYLDGKKRENFNNQTLIFKDGKIKNPSWRSISKLTDLLQQTFPDDKKFNLSEAEFKELLPKDFIWRNENDIIQLVGNLFYIACCQRVNKQIEYSKTDEVFDNAEWLKTAPWTILNKLFEDLKFKYRFKTDYEYNTPYMDENPKLREGNEIRNLYDLSDGEKAILKLALISLDEEISKDLKVVMFDEYDAPLNPSLTEAFYHVIDEFYLKKGIQVIITTHSPATISLAPETANFYEVFAQENSSPKIVSVNQYDYEELKEANKSFYNKIKNQENRITELESSVASSGNMLFVEDTYEQIYKIAYLKIKGIPDITEQNFEEKFSEIANFAIHGQYGSGGLYNVLSCPNFTRDENSKIICLFDFDSEGYEKFKKTKNLKLNDIKVYGSKQGSIRNGLYIKHNKIDKYALLLAIPERLEQYITTESSNYCFIEIESLLSEEYLSSNNKAKIVSQSLNFHKMKDNHKKDFWKDLFRVDKEHFKDFEPLFTTIENIFNIN